MTETCPKCMGQHPGQKCTWITRCGETIEKLPSGIRVRLCGRRVKAWGQKCWQHR